MENTQKTSEALRKQFGNLPSFKEVMDRIKAKREAEKAVQQPKE